MAASCLRRLVSSAACFVTMDSDRASMSLCQEVDTRAAFACARFAYSIARSRSKCRPVVRTGSVSLGAGRGLPKRTFMTPVSAIVARRCRRIVVVCYALSNAIQLPARPLRTRGDCATAANRRQRCCSNRMRDACHNLRKDCGHTAIPQSPIGALSMANHPGSALCPIANCVYGRPLLSSW